ncbi:uncharacterized protein [Dermacentor andersoni]|uniref:uncharacterized protein n=1 Tax=Dermacentor andersoni TaxID=34620 RepID=UPI003B3B7596
MNGNRYRNTRRPPWSQSNNSQRWQPRSNVSIFGYRRHELNDKSPSTYHRQGASEESVKYSEDDNEFGFRRQQEDNFQSLDSYDADSGAGKRAFPASRSVGRHVVEQPGYEVHDLMKAAFDTDFRFSSRPHQSEERHNHDSNWNPYRAVSATAAQQKQPQPILKNKTSNPWKAQECSTGNIAGRDAAPVQVHQSRKANVDSSIFDDCAGSPSPRRPPSRAPPQCPSNATVNSPVSRGLLPTPDRSPIPLRPRTPNPTRPRTPNPVRPRTPNPVRPHTPARITCPDEPAVWETPPCDVGTRGYFESLKHREQEKTLFGRNDVPQSSFRVDCPTVNCARQSPPRELNFTISGSDETLTFTDFRIKNDGVCSRFLGNDSGPENVPSIGFQGTWRGRGPEGNKMSSSSRNFVTGQESQANKVRSSTRNFVACQESGVNGVTFEARHEQAPGRVAAKRQNIGDARLILDKKRKSTFEEDSEENTESSQQQPANKAASAPSRFPSQKVMKESVQHNTRLWVESHFSESDPAITHAPDIHEVDESKLLPTGIQPEAISYVVFLDIDKRSCFEEVKQPFLPGTLLYLFYGDPSVLLPTREHPFYKDNRGSWAHFYPDCGTEYGSYLVAAPAVITWMDQKLPQKVKFLVHGHRKLLHLDNLLRKVIYYPTSRTLDVQLLNRMLKGDFDSANRPNTAPAPAAIKTIVIRSAAAPLGGNPLPVQATKNIPVHSPRSQTPGSSHNIDVQPRTPVKSPTASRKRMPILAPGQSPPKPPKKPPRQKVLWDL